MKSDKKSFARSLRRRSTDAERRLWYYLRDRRLGGYKFRRQVALGPYVADFVCLESRLIVELDGGQHVAQAAYDARRDAWLAEQGFRVLRFDDSAALKQTDAVREVILRALEGISGAGTT